MTANPLSRLIYARAKMQHGHVTRRYRVLPHVTHLLVAGIVVASITLIVGAVGARMDEARGLSQRMDELAGFDMYKEWRR